MQKSIMVAILLLLTACGYHLRDTVEKPLNLRTILLQNASEQLELAMRKKLRAMGKQWLIKAKPDTIIVRITRENMNRRVLSLSSTGRVNEYELYYHLSFNLLDTAGHDITDEQVIEINRDYFNNQQNILGKNNEEQLIRQEIYSQSVQLILNRCVVLTNQRDK